MPLSHAEVFPQTSTSMWCGGMGVGPKLRWRGSLTCGAAGGVRSGQVLARSNLGGFVLGVYLGASSLLTPLTSCRADGRSRSVQNGATARRDRVSLPPSLLLGWVP